MEIEMWVICLYVHATVEDCINLCTRCIYIQPPGCFVTVFCILTFISLFLVTWCFCGWQNWCRTRQRENASLWWSRSTGNVSSATKESTEYSINTQSWSGHQTHLPPAFCYMAGFRGCQRSHTDTKHSNCWIHISGYLIIPIEIWSCELNH